MTYMQNTTICAGRPHQTTIIRVHLYPDWSGNAGTSGCVREVVVVPQDEPSVGLLVAVVFQLHGEDWSVLRLIEGTVFDQTFEIAECLAKAHGFAEHD